MSALPKWVKEKEVASITGYSLAKLQQDRHYNRGLPYYKLGKGAVRYKLSDVLAWMEAQRVDPEAITA